MRTLSKYLMLSFAVVLTYTVVELVVSTVTGVAHDTVTTCLYAFFGTEIGSCAFIRIIDKVKTKKEEDDEQG